MQKPKGKLKAGIKGVITSIKPKTAKDRRIKKDNKAYKRTLENEFPGSFKKGGTKK
jgi:hypothetical protein